MTGNSNPSLFHSEPNRIAWLKLKLVPGLGNRSVLHLLEAFGSPENILRAGLKDLKAPGVAREAALESLAAKRFVSDPDEVWGRLKERNFRLLCLGDPDYPSNLAGIPDPPAVLFVSGTIEPRDLVSVAVVGSRFASPAGIIFTRDLCSELAASGVTVVSGFAVGIDSAAHRGAIAANGRTLAVLGCGLDLNYPSINADLKREIARSGALLTEFNLGIPPAPGNFPARNRIISGLSLGVVVVEAAERSGSLITARCALEQGREVFAVPGVAGSVRSSGAHRLIRQGAKLAECAEDILEEIRPLIRKTGPLARRRPAEAGPVDSRRAQDEGRRARTESGPVTDEKYPAPDENCRGDESILLRIMDKVPKHIDEIAHDTGIPVHRAAAMLLALELKGLVSQLPGKYFICSRPGR